MSITIAEADVLVKAKGDAKKIGQGIADDVERGGSSSGEKRGRNIGLKIFGGIVAAGAAVGTAAIGGMLVSGFQRLEAIDNARAKLTGLGHDAGSVESIMTNALGAVKGTAFGMDAAAGVAASAVAAGIQPGEALQRTLTLVADAATIAGTDMGAMGAIFNKVAASNKVQMDSINQLHDAGVPALQFLAAELGVTAEEASKMASKGEIDFATFQAAMEEGLGGAAQSSGDTFSGAMANVRAALSRTGANLLSGVFPVLAPMLQGIQAALGPVEDSAAAAGAALGDVLAPAFEAVGRWLENPDFSAFDGILGTVRELGQQAAPVLIGIGAALMPLAPMALQLAESIGDATVSTGVSAFGLLLTTLEALTPIITGAVTAIGGIVDFLTTTPGLMEAVVVGLTAWKVAQLALSLAFNASGIGLIITAVGLLIAGLVWVATETTFFQDAWQWMVDAVGNAWTWLNDNVIQPVATAIGDALTWVNENVIQPVSTAIGDAFAWIGEKLEPLRIGFLIVFGIIAGIVTWAFETLILPAIQLLGEGFRWLNENIVQPVFAAIGTAIRWVWDSVISPVVNFIKLAIQGWGMIFQWLYANVVQPVMRAIGTAIQWVYNSIITPVGNFIKNAIRGIGSVFSWLYNNAVKPAMDGVGSALRWVQDNVIRPVSSFIKDSIRNVGDVIRDVFGGIGDFIGNAFQSAANAVKGPLNGIIGLVNGAINGLNAISVTIPDWVPEVGGTTFGVSIPNLPYLARGSNNAPDAFIAGENGPELITNAGGATVTPYSQTRAAFDRQGAAAVGDGGRSIVVERGAIQVTSSNPELAARQTVRELVKHL